MAEVALGAGEGGRSVEGAGGEVRMGDGGLVEGRGEGAGGAGNVVEVGTSPFGVAGDGGTAEPSGAAPLLHAPVPNQVERRAASNPGAPSSLCRLTTCGTVPPPELVSLRAVDTTSSPVSAAGEADRGTSSSISISAPSSLSLFLRSTAVRPLATLAKLAPLDLAFPFIVMLLLPLRPLRMLSLSSSISAFWRVRREVAEEDEAREREEREGVREEPKRLLGVVEVMGGAGREGVVDQLWGGENVVSVRSSGRVGASWLERVGSERPSPAPATIEEQHVLFSPAKS